MSPFELIHRPVLCAAKPLEASKIRLAPLPEGAILQVVGLADGVAAVTEAAGQAGLSLRPNGPGQWFLVGDAAMTRTAIDALRGTLGDGFAVIDQSHGRIRIAVEGSAVESVLAKGTGIDLAAFPAGDATSTLIGHISVHLSRQSATRFELMSLRGFAESLWHDLQTMAGEFSDPRH
ncbi:sarcosine oxidase subunit gamma [Rhizobium sp.]